MIRIGTFIKCKGYEGTIEYSPDNKLHYGLLICDDLVNYQADTIEIYKNKK